LQSSRMKFDLEHSEDDLCWSQSVGWKKGKDEERCDDKE